MQEQSHMDGTTLESSGWERISVGDFSGQLGPFWMRGTPGDRTIGFIAEARHTNKHLGTIHGGMLMTFADICLGFGAADALGNTNCTTAQLQLHFVAAGRVGDFVTCKPELVRRGAQLIFLRGLIIAGAKTIASTDGIWKVLDQKPR
jgi:acyl-coenzyme A thioesterase PaaI-like protein